MKKIASIVIISRPINFLITFASIIVAGIICSGKDYAYINILLAGISGALVASAGNIINDFYDIDVDKINRPDRVLPREFLSLKEAVRICFFFNSAAVIISIYINIYAVTIVLLSILIIFLYSYKLKNIPFLGNFVVAFFTGLAFIYGGIAVSNWTYAIIPAIFAFFINLIREILKDMEDAEGDRISDIQTFPLKYGFTASINLIYWLTVVLIILTTFPFFLKIYKIEYFIIIMTTVNLLLVYFLREVKKDQTKKNLSKMSKLLKLSMLLGLIAIYLGA